MFGVADRVGPAERRDVEQLVILPPVENAYKLVGDWMMFLCEVSGAHDGTDYDIKWFEGDAGDREIVAQSGRSVTLIVQSICCFPYIRTNYLTYPA